MIPGLEILNLHAQGGMAEVYRARGKGADGQVWQYAVKRILPELTADATLRAMFVEEARVASLLVHPNIVRVYDLARGDEDDYYIVMEFLEGRDLAETIDRCIDQGRTLPVWLAIHVAREVLHALTYATTTAVDREGRALALIHRDISPHNIFICFDGQVKLTDFGVAKVAQSNVLTQVGVTKGKFGYMSPEQLMSEKLDFRSDLYNVGIMLYETLTCRRLFFGDNASQFLQAMLAAEVPALDPALRVPPELESLMRRALSRGRDGRPASPQQFDDELRYIAERYQLTAMREHVSTEMRQFFGSEIESCPVPARASSAPKRLASVSAALPRAVARVPSGRIPLSPAPQSGAGLEPPPMDPVVPYQQQQQYQELEQQQQPMIPVVPVAALGAPTIVPAQHKNRGLSDPSLEIGGLPANAPPPSSSSSAGAPARPKTRERERELSRPVVDTRRAHGSKTHNAPPPGPDPMYSTAPRPGTRSVRALPESADGDPITAPVAANADAAATIPPESAPSAAAAAAAASARNRRGATIVVGGAGAKALVTSESVDDDWDGATSTSEKAQTPTNRGGVVMSSSKLVPLPASKKK